MLVSFNCKGHLENAPIPIVAALPILMCYEIYLSKSIITKIHRKLEHAERIRK